MKRILFILLGLGILFVPITAGATRTLTFEKWQITHEFQQQNGPIVYGNTVVWADWRDLFGQAIDIWGYNFDTQEEFPIITRPGDQRPEAINRKYILYSDIPAPSESDVRLYNRETGEDFTIADGSDNQTAGGISGANIIYVVGSAVGDLYVYNLNHKEAKFITNNVSVPRISGHKIVWYYGNSIHGYDLSKKDFFEITNGFASTPDIYQNNVVWRGSDGIYYKNLKTNSIKKIADQGSWPRISNKFITWVQDDGIGAHNIYAYDLKTGQTVQVSNDGPQQPSPTIPSIWRDTIVWMSWHTGNGDVYAAKLHY